MRGLEGDTPVGSEKVKIVQEKLTCYQLQVILWKALDLGRPFALDSN